MIKSELLDIVTARNRHLYRRDVEHVVDAILETVSQAFDDGDRVELRGFGSFSVRHYSARQGRNPKTGETVAVGEKWVPAFKASKGILQRLNQGSTGDRKT